VYQVFWRKAKGYEVTMKAIAQNITDHYALYNGDCVELIRDLPDNSIGLSVFSPPFPGMYAYTDSARDMGNVKSIDEMLDQFRFFAPELLRVMMPGRRACLHLTQVPRFKYLDGYIGLRDFRGKTIALMEDEGWIYYGETCINKCPVLKAQRTKDATLAMKSLCLNTAITRPALADYLLYFMKRGESERLRNGSHEKYPECDGPVSGDTWQKWARPVWDYYRPASSDDPCLHGIRETNVLKTKAAKDQEDEKHLCPLQLDVIERAVMMWSGPGETVLSPFAGIGSEGYVSIQKGRRFVGFELKPSYYRVAIKNLDQAVRDVTANNAELF